MEKPMLCLVCNEPIQKLYKGVRVHQRDCYTAYLVQQARAKQTTDYTLDSETRQTIRARGNGHYHGSLQMLLDQGRSRKHQRKR